LTCPYSPPYMTYSPYMTCPSSPYTNRHRPFSSCWERRGLTGSSSAVPLTKVAEAQLSFSADDVKDKYSLAVVAVEYPAGEVDDLAIARAAKLPRHRSAFGVTRELVYVCEDPLDEPTCGLRVVKSDIVGDGIKVV
jgi:hypothetical protein